MRMLRLARLLTVGIVGIASLNVYGGVMQLDFNTDGVLPNQENASLNRVTNGGMTDEVVGGLWRGNSTDVGPSGYLYYGGNIAALATTDTTLPLSINVRTRLLEPVNGTTGVASEYYYNIRGPAGHFRLAFRYDPSNSDPALQNMIGGRSSAGALLWRSLPNGFSLGDFHILTATWDPTSVAALPVELYVDGISIGNTYAALANFNTNGYIEFGDGNTSPPDSGSTRWETDWVRFGNDEVVIVPEPTSLAVAAALGLMGLGCRRRRCRTATGGN